MAEDADPEDEPFLIPARNVNALVRQGQRARAHYKKTSCVAMRRTSFPEGRHVDAGGRGRGDPNVAILRRVGKGALQVHSDLGTWRKDR